jgi:hypothetical protein
MTEAHGRGLATHGVDEAKCGGDVEINGGARIDPIGTAGPLKARGAIAFGRRVASTCPVPSDRQARCRPQRH